MLVVGAQGQLGRALGVALARAGRDAVLAARSPGAGGVALDLRDADAVARVVAHVRPSVVLNAAAYTAVDRAQEEVDAAFDVNARGPARLARACADVDALLVHFSTDYVFDGSADRAYVEDDPVCPINVYGRSKALGEEEVRASAAKHLIFRTSWLYAPGGHNFVATMLRLFRRPQPVRVVDDQIGCPTSAIALGDALVRLLVAHGVDDLAARGGLYHLCASGETSWFGFACAIAERARPRPHGQPQPIDSSAYPSAAARPPRSVLDCSLARTRLGLELAHWRDQLDEAMPQFNALAAGDGG